MLFLVVFFFKNYLLSYATSVRLSVRLSSVEIISFRDNLITNMSIDLKIGLNGRYGIVDVRKAWFFKFLITPYVDIYKKLFIIDYIKSNNM